MSSDEHGAQQDRRSEAVARTSPPDITPAPPGSSDRSDDLLVERLLRVIDEGRRTATYKLALVAALIDAVAITSGASEIPTRLIAERVLALYYPQSRLYTANDGTRRELRQISGGRSAILPHVFRLRVAGDAHNCRSIDDVKLRLPELYIEVLDEVETTFVRYPIPLLQTVGSTSVPFLYHVDWPELTSVLALRRRDADRVRLLPGVADRLIVLGPMLRPLIELHWTRDVARWTKVSLEDEALQHHLFGSQRVSFPAPLVAGLRELQAGRCFYCDEPLPGRGHVDHFLAWSRWPNDAIENLVLTDTCNVSKSDHLVVAEHVDRWRARLGDSADSLRSIASDARWTSDPRRTLGLVRSTYAHIASGTPLWRSRHADFELANGPIKI